MKTYICGCVKNCGSHLDDVFANIGKVATLYEDFVVIIAYDESQDDSLEILRKYKEQYKERMTVIENPNPTTNIRTENISNARNSILRTIRALDNPAFEYMIMIDMDDVCAGTMNIGALSQFINQDDWDMLSFNRTDYYDIWALSIAPCLFSCWHFQNPRECVELMKGYVTAKLNGIADDELLPCVSAFNGFGVYRLSAFEHCNYDWRLDGNMRLTEKLYPNFMEANCKALNKRTDIRQNSDCEHRKFHMSAIMLNGARIRISKQCLFRGNLRFPLTPSLVGG